MMTPSQSVREAYLAALKAKHAADIAASQYDLTRALALATLGAPAGWSFDLFGDGELKPQGECAKACPLSSAE